MDSLSTGRLKLRGWEQDDAEFVLDMYSRWAVQQYLGRDPRLMDDLGQAHALIERLRAFDSPLRRYWAVETLAERTLVGTVMLQPIRPSGSASAQGSGETEIGWHFHPDHWGHGFAGEAATAILAHAFGNGADEIVAVTAAANTASQKVCDRIGMKHAGQTDRYYDAICELFIARRPHDL